MGNEMYICGIIINKITHNMSKELEKTTENKITGYNPFAEIKGERIVYVIGNPREWRANCSASGSFRLGTASQGELSLKMSVLHYVDYPKHHFFSGTYGAEDWVLIYFVDENNVLSTMYVKGSSGQNFRNMTIDLLAKKTPMATQIITATMRPASNDKGKFHVVEFSHEQNTNKAHMRLLSDFWNDHVTYDETGNVLENLIYSEFAVQQLAKHNELKG